jgi:hypothetical protein
VSDPAASADATVEADRFTVDPLYGSDDDNDVPQSWELADRVRGLLRQKAHDGKDRADLQRAVERQLRTTGLYREVGRIVKAATGTADLTMYVLLFPGEARDNTGLKDLNDNVLGYTLQQQFTARRQQEIETLFQPAFTVVGQDFKTALFVGWQQTRAEFDKRLHQLDKALRKMLLDEFLPKSKKAGAKELKRVLEKDPDYRFDIYYGTDVLAVGRTTRDLLLVAFLLLTQALKGAATARYVSKGRSLKVRVVKPFGRNAEPDKRLDPRGKGFEQKGFLKVAATAPAIKRFVLKAARDHDNFLEYNEIWVDTVWTQAFFRHQNVANRDVVRDVRKKKLERPPRPNVKYTVRAQREILELWIVVLNLIDFIKDFLQREFDRDLLDQHDRAVALLDDLRDPAKPVDVRELETFLTRDVRLRQVAALGTTSEFQFFATAADHAARIVFMLDVRDLGVEVLLMYDVATGKILDGKLADRQLLRETVESTDVVTEMRRFTHALVLTTLGRYHALLTHSARMRRTDGSKEAAIAFRKAFSRLGTFEEDVQVMLGGDEIMIALHPRFAAYVHNIVADLSETILGPGPVGPDARAGSPRLKVRAGVAFSLARTEGKRSDHQIAHNKAMRLADESHAVTKDLERRERRIERLIEKLEANAKKKDQAPAFRKQLAALRLGRLFTRVQHGAPQALSAARVEQVVAGLRTGALARQDAALVELVDHQGKVVDRQRLLQDADGLERAVRKAVGSDNVHVDLPPARKIPVGEDDDEDEK